MEYGKHGPSRRYLVETRLLKMAKYVAGVNEKTGNPKWHMCERRREREREVTVRK
jgi:hypothetical protein